MEYAAFKLDYYKFTKASFNFNIPNNAILEIKFKPKGIFYKNEKKFHLNFDVQINNGEKTNVVDISCDAQFKFNSPIDSVPDYFFSNSIAILFPYIRAFVSTISLQANTNPIMLPTLNLMGLTDELRQNTDYID